jgi:DNA-binding PadR family transcriptional regulator
MTQRNADRRVTPAVLHILLALSSGERHGYALMQEIPVLSSGKLKLGPATLYRTLQGLLALGWIEESALEPEDPRRRTYRLSRRGRAALKEEMKHFAALVAVARERKILGLEGSQ